MIGVSGLAARWSGWTLLMTGLAVAITSVWLAWRGPAFSFAGTSPYATIAEVTAGWALIGVGIASSRRRPTSRFGLILAGAGLAWFLDEWPNPASAGSVIFSVGLLFHIAYPALIAHAAIVFPDGRVGGRIARTAVAAAYLTNIVVLGLLPAMFFEPGSARCPGCPGNLLALGSNAEVAMTATQLGLLFEVSWIVVVIMLMTERLFRATVVGRRLIAPVLFPAVALFVFVAIDAIHAFQRGVLSNDPLDLWLWYGQAVAIVALAAGVELETVRARRARQQVARIVLDLAGSPPAGQLRDRLAVTLGDSRLRLAYAVSGGRLADAQGRLLTVVPEKGRTDSRVERATELVAVLSHRSDLIDDPERLYESIAAARLAVKNEQLHAQTQVQVEDLRASRVRIVDAADRERRRLERDLHDGAQPRLVHLSMAVSLARLRVDDDGDKERALRLAAVDVELRHALADLREVAHGVYPVELAEGLAAGIAVLAEGAPIPLQVHAMPDIRLDPAVEAAAYFLIAEATFHSRAKKASVRVDRSDNRLVIDVDVDGPGPVSMVGLEDRVGALDGSISMHSQPGGNQRIHAEIPCAS